jgi:hypothetical protein
VFGGEGQRWTDFEDVALGAGRADEHSPAQGSTILEVTDVIPVVSQLRQTALVTRCDHHVVKTCDIEGDIVSVALIAGCSSRISARICHTWQPTADQAPKERR